MPSIHTYYSQPLYDRMTEAAKNIFGSNDPKRIDKFIKACLKYSMENLDDLKRAFGEETGG